MYVEDLVELLRLVQQGEGFDIVNVSTENTWSINELFEIVKTQMNKPDAKAEYSDEGHFWSHYPNLYKGEYRISDNILKHEVGKRVLLSNKHAFEKYGWKPKVSIEEGVKATIDFSLNVLQSAKGF